MVLRLTAILLALLLTIPGAVAASGCQAVLLPSYFTVGSGSDFYRLFADVRARTRVATITIGPCGDLDNLTPCVRSFDTVKTDYVDVVKAAKVLGIKVLGYVFTDGGRRAVDSVKAEISLYRTRYAVDGIFFDQTPNSSDDATYLYFKGLSDFVRSSFGGMVVLNFGAQPVRSHYFRLADVIVTFEGSYSAYLGQWSAPPPWMAEQPAAKVAHLVHTVPLSIAAMTTVITLSQSRNAGLIYATDAVGLTAKDNPWNRLPKFWQAELDRLGFGCRQPGQ